MAPKLIVICQSTCKAQVLEIVLWILSHLRISIKTTVMKLRLALILLCLLGIGLFARTQDAQKTPKPKVENSPALEKDAKPLPPPRIVISRVDTPRFRRNGGQHSPTPPPPTRIDIKKHVPPPPPPPIDKDGNPLPAPKVEAVKFKPPVIIKTKDVPPPPPPPKPSRTNVPKVVQEDEHPLPPPPPKPGKVKGAPVTPDTPPLELEKT
jgi:hypothetical protein